MADPRLASFVEEHIDPRNIVKYPKTPIVEDLRARRAYIRILGISDTDQVNWNDPRIQVDMRAKLVWVKFGGYWTRKAFIDLKNTDSRYPDKKNKIFDQEQLNVFNLTRSFGFFRSINTSKTQWDKLAAKLAHHVNQQGIREIVEVAMQLAPSHMTGIQFNATTQENDAMCELWTYEPRSKHFLSNNIPIKKKLGLEKMTAQDWAEYSRKRKELIDQVNAQDALKREEESDRAHTALAEQVAYEIVRDVTADVEPVAAAPEVVVPEEDEVVYIGTKKRNRDLDPYDDDEMEVLRPGKKRIDLAEYVGKKRPYEVGTRVKSSSSNGRNVGGFELPELGPNLFARFEEPDLGQFVAGFKPPQQQPFE